MERKFISNSSLIVRIVLSILIVSLLVAFISTEYLKKTAINNLASDDAHKTAQLVFETMNTRMQEGWTKKDLKGIIDRLEYIRQGMQIASYRSESVEQIFGVVPEDKKTVQSDPLIQKAMKGEELFFVDEETGTVRFLYPMKMNQNCVVCHSNSKAGTINGVLDIQFPHSDIKISIDAMSFYFIVLMVIFLLILSAIFYLIINTKMVKPVVKLTNEIKSVEKSKDLTKRSNIETNIEELAVLQNSFNKLLGTIKYYYDKLLESIYRDELTKVDNYIKLQKDIHELKTDLSLMVLDISSFGKINRVYGTNIADKLLFDFAEFLSIYMKDRGTVYRLYGDEFAIVYKGKLEKEFVTKLTEKIKEHKFFYKNIEFSLDITTGYVDSYNGNMIEQANIALKYAKSNYKRIVKYDETLKVKEEDINHLTWAKKLDDAINNDNLVPYFMPMKNTATQKIDKYETLVRLVENDEVYTPDKFLHVAVASGKYHIITQTMIRKSFEYFKDKPGLKFSINFSLSDILNKQTRSLLLESLKKYENSQNVVIELLETEEISDFELLNDFIKEVKEHGAKIAIDDFGSGFSNFNYILNLNVDIIKLDSSLVQNIYTDQDSAVVVSNIARVVKELGLEVIAERVSDEKIENILTVHEIDYLQGFHIGMPSKEIKEEKN